MPEDQFAPIRGSQLRTSRYPGFSSPRVSQDAQALTAGGGGAAGGGFIDQPFPSEEIEIPRAENLVKGAGELAGGAALQWTGTKFGSGVGAALESGASFGDALNAGADSTKKAVETLFDFGGGESATGGAAGGANAGAAPLTLAGGGAGAGAASGSINAPVGSAESSLFGGSAGFGDAASATAAEGARTAGVTAAETGAREAGATAAASSSGGSTLASQSFSERLVSGSNLGGAAASGVIAAGLTLLTGGTPKQAVRTGAGSAAGFAIGNAAFPGIGGIVGGAIGGIIGGGGCFVAGTKVLMADGTFKAVEQVEDGEVTFLGGTVIGGGYVRCVELYEYRGVHVSGGHAVLEGARWLRVRESEKAVRVALDRPVKVYTLITEHGLMVLERFIAADFAEVPESTSINDAQRIDALNASTARNYMLAMIEGALLPWSPDQKGRTRLVGGGAGHGAGTHVLMADRTWKPIEQISIGDEVMLGGKVWGRFETFDADAWQYRQTVVAGRQLVFEKGAWVQARDAKGSVPIEAPAKLGCHALLTERHIVIVKGAAAPWVSADCDGIDATWAKSEDLVGAILNSPLSAVRNAALRDIEHRLTQPPPASGNDNDAPPPPPS